MSEIAPAVMLVAPLGALALRFWLRARRAEALLADGDRRHHELVRLAERDPLTGVANRRGFDRALAELQDRAATPGSGALILLDLDNFKQVNDRLGHQRGDEVLRDVARAIRRRFRDTDLVARLGGDEFAVLLRDVDPQRAQAVADDLRARVRQACEELPLRRAGDASVGGAPLGSETRDGAEPRAPGGAAVYRVKAARPHRGPRRGLPGG